MNGGVGSSAASDQRSPGPFPGVYSTFEVKPNEVVLSQYLGQGAYGAVYRGLWSGTEVAVKIVNEDVVYQSAFGDSVKTTDIEQALRVFFQECQLMGSLAHPNVVQFLGACRTGRPRMLLLEYLPGGTLENVFCNVHVTGKPLTFETATKYAVDIAKGMAYLHHNPHRTVIHRDIKPSNLILDKTGTVKVADFGLSKAVDESRFQLHRQSGRGLEAEVQRLTTSSSLQKSAHASPFEQRGYQVGTYIYMPAELFRSKSDYTSKVDVYSFAMILYELFEGVQPFHEYAANPLYAAAAAASGQRPEMDRTPKFVRELIERCWHELPEERPTFLEILNDLSMVKQMIDFDKSTQARVRVFLHYAANAVLFGVTLALAILETHFVNKSMYDGNRLFIEGEKAGLVKKAVRRALSDPLLIWIQEAIPVMMVVASLMFFVFPNKKVKALIRERGPRFTRRNDEALYRCMKCCCGGLVQVVRRLTLVAGVLSVVHILSLYEYRKYILDILCNGEEEPFHPPKGIDADLCDRNYRHVWLAVVFQFSLLCVNLLQLLFHLFGIPEGKIQPSRFELNHVAMVQSFHKMVDKMESKGSNHSSEGMAPSVQVDERSPLIGKPITAKEFYFMKRSPSMSSLDVASE